MKMKKLFFATAIAVSLAASATIAFKVDEGTPNVFRVHHMTVKNPKASIIKLPNGTVYLDMSNAGPDSDRLIGADAIRPDGIKYAENCALHTHSLKDGIMTMQHVSYIEVKPGQTIKLEPGGMHIMLHGVTQEARNRDTIPMTLYFEKAGPVSVEVPVNVNYPEAPAAPAVSAPAAH